MLRLKALAVYAVMTGASILVFPPTFKGALVDEWAYALPAYSMAAGGGIKAARTAIAPNFAGLVLGGGTAAVAGPSLLPLRLWSIAFLIVAAMLCYSIARRLGAPWGWAVTAGAVFIANPIAWPVGSIFMTDMPFTAILGLGIASSIAWLNRRGGRTALHVGAASAIALLIRPQGILVPIGCALVALAAHRVAPDVTRLTRAEWAGLFAPCVAAIGVLAVWLVSSGGPSVSMARYTTEAFEPTTGSFVKVATLLPPISWLYVGLVAAPLGLAALASAIFSGRSPARVGRWAMAAGPLAAIGLALLGRSMPYLSWGSTLSSNGIGGGDRQNLPSLFWMAVALATAASAAGVGYLITCRTPSRYRSPERLLLLHAVLQLVGAAPLGLAFDDQRVAYDRYLLPVFLCLIPLLAAKAARAGVGRRAGVALLAIMALLTLAGMQDWMAQRQVAWSTLESMEASGVPLDKLDGGFEWDSYQMSEARPRHFDPDQRPWYIQEYAPAVDPEWALAREPQPGYTVIGSVRWQSWIRSGEMLMQHRNDNAGPGGQATTLNTS